MEKRLLSFLFLLITIIASAQTNTLPVIRLAGQFSNDYQAGTVSLYLPDGTSQELMEATIKWRGGTTNTENTHKRNYTIKFSEDKQFFGLRKDNKWLLDAGNADVWIYKYAGHPATLQEIYADYHGYGEMKAWKTAQVYGCDTEKSGYFEEASFHPERVLLDFIIMLHPELRLGYLRYYHKIK